MLCPVDGMCPKLVLTTHEREWRNPVSELRGIFSALIEKNAGNFPKYKGILQEPGASFLPKLAVKS